MKVKELFDLLSDVVKEFPDHDIVVSSDPEGNEVRDIHQLSLATVERRGYRLEFVGEGEGEDVITIWPA